VYELSSRRTAATVLAELAARCEALRLDPKVIEKIRVMLFADARHVAPALAAIANAAAGARRPVALMPVGKPSDVSRATGWGNVHKAGWASAAAVPDLLSAAAAAPQVPVDYWRVRVSTGRNAAMLRHLPKAFRRAGEVVRTRARRLLCLVSHYAPLSAALG
jgi:hypothetical protein